MGVMITPTSLLTASLFLYYKWRRQKEACGTICHETTKQHAPCRLVAVSAAGSHSFDSQAACGWVRRNLKDGKLSVHLPGLETEDLRQSLAAISNRDGISPKNFSRAGNWHH